MPDHLRPIERRVLAMRAQGMGPAEIAARFKRSPQYIERIIWWTVIPRRQMAKRSGLTPFERRVLAMRREGHSHAEIARRFQRGPDHIRRVEAWAELRITWAEEQRHLHD